jgi:cytochrome c oxidase assembly factor CtaG
VYSGYTATTTPWGLEPLTDQQPADVITRIPAGMVYLTQRLPLMVAWYGQPEHENLVR